MNSEGGEQHSGDSSPFTPLAIIGIGCIFPQAKDQQTFWCNIRDGVDSITEVPATHWKAEDYFNKDPKAPDQVYAKLGGFLPSIDFEPMKYGVLPNAIEAIDTAQLLSLVAVEQALDDAGYGNDSSFDREKVSVILGVTGALELVIPLGARLGHPRWREALKDSGVADDVAEDVVQRIADSYVPWQENSFPGLLGNVVAGRISKHFNFGGTNCVVDAACGSSLSALNLAALELATGRADMVVSGGVDTFNDIFMYSCFSKTPALSPSGHAKPFDANADGTTLGEGVGVVLLKRLADAERDGDKIYAKIKGLGTSSDGSGSAIYEPDSTGQQKALLRAYAQGNISPASIALIEAHGTGTRVGDAVEVKALRQVFGESDRPWCALGSVKSQIGHTKAAAGVAGLIKSALALHHKILPPTIKVDHPQSDITGEGSAFFINKESQPWLPHGEEPRRAGVSALGFGGSNYHCLLEEYTQEKQGEDWNANTQLLTLSAPDRASLLATLQQYPADTDWLNLRRLAAQSRETFDSQADCRLTWVVERKHTDTDAQRKRMVTMLNQNDSSWQTPDGAFFASGTVTSDLAILFPGQGTQYPGMLKDLALHFPTFLHAIQQADYCWQQASDHGPKLSEYIFSRSSFDAADTQAAKMRLQSTAIAQPALGAVSAAALAVLRSFGVQADAFAGHSYGEIPALFAAGTFDAKALHGISRSRGELMAKAGDSNRGSMLAVFASLSELEELLDHSELGLVLANKNTPNQGVLSGSNDAIDAAEKLFQQQEINFKRLDVAAAFHSALVSDASLPFAECLQKHSFQKPTSVVYANSTGKVYPEDVDDVRQLLAGQLAQPVEFVAEIEQMYQSGIRTFVEVGPHSRLSSMVKSILGERPHHTLAVDASQGQRSGVYDMACVLAQLAALGHRCSVQNWDTQPQQADETTSVRKPVMRIPLCGINHFKPPKKRAPVLPTQRSSTSKEGSGSNGATMAASKDVLITTPSNKTTNTSASKIETSPPQSSAVVQPSHQGTTGSKILSAKSNLKNNMPALQMAQQAMQALQDMQLQTARLHEQFLTGQEEATRSFTSLMETQQHLLLASAGETVVSSPTKPAVVESPPLLPPIEKPTVMVKQAPATAAAPLAAPDMIASDSIHHTLFAIISEKTGYPSEMLDLEMTLDGDLGIDSIKRVEILAALQQQLPNAPTIRPEDLSVLQTLAQIIAHLQPKDASDPAIIVSTQNNIGDTLFEVVAEKTGYPIEMLEADMTLDGDLGIDSIKRVEILSALQEQLPDAPTINPEDLGVLQTLGQITAHLQQGQVASIATATSHGLQHEVVIETLFAVVAEKTGYPVNMLEPMMSLDTDLGIDSIKRVEILSSLQEQLPDAPVIRPEDLASLRTLDEISKHLSATVNAETSLEHPATAVRHVERDTVAATLLGVVAEKTGYPIEMLELEMALDRDLGIDSIKRVEILSALQEQLPDAPAIKPEHLGNLQTLGQIVDFLTSIAGAVEDATSVSTQQSSQRTQQATKSSTAINRQLLKVVPLPVDGMRDRLLLPSGAHIRITDDGTSFCDHLCAEFIERGLQAEKFQLGDSIELPDCLHGLIILTPKSGANDAFLQQAFLIVQQAEAALKSAKGGFLATVSRLNSCFGLAPGGKIEDVLSGGLAGLLKTAQHEWPKLRCTAFDLISGLEDRRDIATILINEAITEGPVEVGVSDHGLHALKLVATPLAAAKGELPVKRGDLVVVSGGARGVTAHVSIALAKSSAATMLLLGRSPFVAIEADWLQGLSTEAAIKKAIIHHAEHKLKPKDVAKEYHLIISQREIRHTLSEIEACGAVACYRSVDLRDADAVHSILAESRAEHGPVKGIIHGAGVLADRLIQDKTIAQFSHVYDTKVCGLRALLVATAEDPLVMMVMFSSSTGRFGRIGQVDYAVANEVLNKIAEEQATQRPNCRVLAPNWGPWDGGMVTPALKKVFSDEGIAVIDLDAGAEYLMQELATAPGGPVEMVILGGDHPVTEQAEVEDATHVASRVLSKAFELELSVDNFPFLKSHVMNHLAVLPMAMMIEWMAHAAIHHNPGFHFHGFNDLRVLKGLTLQQGECKKLQLMTGKAIKSDGVHIVPVELSTTTANGQSLLHARAKIVVADHLPQSKDSSAAKDLTPWPHDDGVYDDDRLFHGPDLHAIQQISGYSIDAIHAHMHAAPAPEQWIKQPLRHAWLTDPLILDGSFQLMILWSFERYSIGSLPVFAGRYRQYVDAFPINGAEVRIHVRSQSSHQAKADIEFIDTSNDTLLARIEGYECVMDASLQASFGRRQMQDVA